MKKCLVLMGLMLLLSGCGSEPTFETVNDENIQPVMAPMQKIMVSLPVDAAVTVLEEETAGTIYLCDGYTVTIHTAASGDMQKTLRSTTGFSKEELRTVQTEYGGLIRTEGVWTAAGENGEQVGRFAVLDDGSYHYVLACMADASVTEELQPVWQELFDSFQVVSSQTELYTGS